MFGEVHKFGGSSLANSQCLLDVVEIVRQLPQDKAHVLVVSAAVGVTDQLYELLRCNQLHSLQLDAIKNQQLRLIDSLLTGIGKQDVTLSFLLDLALLRLRLLENTVSEADLVSLGEFWSARLLAELLSQQGLSCEIINPKSFLILDQQRDFIDEKQARDKLLGQYQGSQFLIVPGFLAADISGQSITLDRGGSDYTAGLIASLLEVDKLHIWTDVEGIRSADPDMVKNTRLLPFLSYDEARRFICNGAGVLHPKTLEPVAKKKIPLVIRSSFRPHGGKTLISFRSSRETLLGFTSSGPFTLLKATNDIIPAGGELANLLKARNAQCFIDERQSYWLLPHTETTFILSYLSRLATEQIAGIEVSSQVTKITAVYGDHSDQTDKLHALLKQCPYELKLCQSEQSKAIFLLVHQRLAKKSMSWLHDNSLQADKLFTVAVVGAGKVGKTLLQQIHNGFAKTYKDYGIQFQVKAIANSRRMLLSHNMINLDEWQDQNNRFEKTDLRKLTEHMQTFDEETIIIDSTASEEVADFHRQWLAKGLHVITANKISCSGEHYHELMSIGQSNRAKYLFETTVGAGLPVLHVARSLVDSGDEFKELQAILSGSLSFLFLELEKGRSFSSVIWELKERGFTEPDPRLDLSGLDVARKLVILARQFDIRLQLSEIELQAVLPDCPRSDSAAEFLANAPVYDGYFRKLIATAQSKKQILRYVARLDSNGKARVGIESLAEDHCFAQLNPADNIVQFTTSRYQANPLMVRGPGAGLDVTAAGLYSDMLRLATV